MKNTITCLLVVVTHLFLAVPFAETATATEEPSAAECSPAYVTWAGAAQAKLRADHPGVALVDFLYVGCKAQSPTTKFMIYKYWVSQGEREFGVYVNLLVDTRSNEVIRSFTEDTDVMIPSYGKWRRLAVEAVQKQYPDLTIIDYRPCRCDLIDATTASQTFKFWIEQDRRKFVNVTIKYNLTDEVVQTISFEESDT